MDEDEDVAYLILYGARCRICGELLCQKFLLGMSELKTYSKRSSPASRLSKQSLTVLLMHYGQDSD